MAHHLMHPARHFGAVSIVFPSLLPVTWTLPSCGIAPTNWFHQGSSKDIPLQVNMFQVYILHSRCGLPFMKTLMMRKIPVQEVVLQRSGPERCSPRGKITAKQARPSPISWRIYIYLLVFMVNIITTLSRFLQNLLDDKNSPSFINCTAIGSSVIASSRDSSPAIYHHDVPCSLDSSMPCILGYSSG
ncbi:hypothetical protein V8F33_000691 [Rhypophila sp. PSN 637]